MMTRYPSSFVEHENYKMMVRMKGLEPPQLALPEPKSGASTSSATSASALELVVHYQKSNKKE